MAGSTGLEPATSGVTGRRSNQLNYDPAWALLGPWSMVHGHLRLRSLTTLDPGLSTMDQPSVFKRANGRYRDRTCDSRRVKPVLYR